MKMWRLALVEPRPLLIPVTVKQLAEHCGCEVPKDPPQAEAGGCNPPLGNCELIKKHDGPICYCEWQCNSWHVFTLCGT